MGMMQLRKDASGQMTIEMAVALPILIVVAAIAVNVMTFFGNCASFDRIAHEAVRIHATAPAYGQDVGQSCALIEQTVRSQLDAQNLNVSVEHSTTGVDFGRYRLVLEYHPTLFGMSLRSSVFGVSLPPLRHEAICVVDEYKPGVIV